MSSSSKGPNAATESLQNKGREAFRQKDYSTAYKFFSQALLTNPPIRSRISLLDNRAASQEKLSGRLPNALQDAKEIIKLENKCVKGYLRAGKVLLLLNKPEQAVSIYRSGLRNVDAEDEHRDLLEGMHKKALEKVESMNAGKVDPLSVLPLELVQMVMDYLSFREKILLQRVSRAWAGLLRSGGIGGRMYRALDFSEARRNVKRRTVGRYVERANGGNAVEEVILNKFVVEGGEILRFVVKRCKNLKGIRVTSNCLISGSLIEALQHQGPGSNLENIVIDCETTLTCVTEVLRLCKKLKMLQCANVEWSRYSEIGYPLKFYTIPAQQLKRLSLAASTNMHINYPSPNYRTDTVHNFSPLDTLEELALTNWSHWLPVRDPGGQIDFSHLKLLTRLTISNNDMETYPYLPPTLKHLELSKCYRLTFTETSITSSPLPRLESLNIFHSPRLTNSHLLSILLPSSSQQPNLISLSISTCPSLDLDSFDFLLNALDLSKLQNLDISENITFGDQASRELGRMESLEKIDVSMTKITGVGLMNLLNNGKGRITRVKCVGCAVGCDAIELARRKGVIVKERDSERYVRYNWMRNI